MRTFLLKYLLFLYLLSIVYLIDAQNIVPISTKTEQYRVLDFYIAETDSKLSEPDFNKLDALNYLPKDSTKFDKNKTYIARFRLNVVLKHDAEMILKIGDKRHSDSAELYVFKDSTLYLKTQSGMFLPRSHKTIGEGFGSKFAIDLKTEESYTFFVRIKNIAGFKPNFKIEILSFDKHAQIIAQRNLIQGFMQGILWIMLLYNLLTYVFSREKSYLFYAMYVFGISFNILTEKGLFIDYVVPDFPQADPFVFIFGTSNAAIGYFQFVRVFLETKQVFPKWDKVLRWILSVNILMFFVLIAILIVNFNIALTVNISNLLNFIGLLFGIVFLIFLMKHGNQNARFFVFGTLFMALGTLITILLQLTGAEVSFDKGYFMNIGTIIQILIFSVGLGYKMKLNEIEKQHVQKQLIEQLTENEALQTKVNRELEEKVRERTSEIEEQKTELEATANQLLERNEEINQQKEELLATSENLEFANREIRLQKELVDDINKDISDSINYAARIQSAMLPEQSLMKSLFSDFFIIFKPRDVVSGDFYWVRNLRGFTIIAVGDCTGHGVPGAFLSMLGISLLNEIVRTNSVSTAGEALDELRKNLKEALHQTSIDSHSKDGIDIAFLAINQQTNIAFFAGAHSKIVVVRNSVSEIYSGDKQPVGIHKIEKAFTNHVINLQTGDRIYMYSDGYIDQFGGLHNEKFKIKRFNHLLSSLQTLSMSEQSAHITKILSEWQGTYPQIDDIVVLGLQI